MLQKNADHFRRDNIKSYSYIIVIPNKINEQRQHDNDAYLLIYLTFCLVVYLQHSNNIMALRIANKINRKIVQNVSKDAILPIQNT